ncbi:Flavin carrier protein 2 [Escovopsis weberi]|uniref:Flavin carrier protein 2 n=1 Tax=Escovopsis weberi TaxID=150374 RepID=A0A0M8MZR6_ESCWE|nr:Flavin carrier protein 2 [Escovopsis weberi]
MLATGVLADDVLRTTGFTECGGDSTVDIDTLSIVYNNDQRVITFDIAGTSSRSQNVTASLDVSAYGNSIFSKSFNPCEDASYVASLCPLPADGFTAKGSQEIPAQFASMVPGIAFQIPDIVAEATLKLKTLDTQETVACIYSQVTNGKSVNQPAVSYVAAGIAGAALVMSGVTAAGAAAGGGTAAGAGGMGSVSPGFTEVAGLFQGMAVNGMLSVSYPPIYRNFAKNFAFSTGLIPWDSLLRTIDNFRANTGGNLTDDNVDWLRNITLRFPDGSMSNPSSVSKRALRASSLFARDVDTTVANTSVAVGADIENDAAENIQKAVSGIQAFAAELSVPKSDIFMTALLVVALVIGLIVMGILLIKAILETWALFGSFPPSLKGFRQHYWNSIARTVTSLILLLYGVWVLYCVFQFTLGDSWAAKALAAVSLGLFTGILAFFSYMIWSTAQRLKAQDGDVSRLFEDKAFWVKYSMFYESYRKSYWWIFIPTIIYLLVKGCVLAAADGHGMVQSILVTLIEAAMLALLVWSRPYECQSKNVLSIAIQTVRFLSVACIFVFVEEFGIAKTTQTVMGVVLIAIQSGLTVTLAILIAWNVFNSLSQMNPHRKRRKEMEKIHDLDDLTPLDARNSLLIGGGYAKSDLEKSMYTVSTTSINKRPSNASYYQISDDAIPKSRDHDAAFSPEASGGGGGGGPLSRSLTPKMPQGFVPTGPPAGMSASPFDGPPSLTHDMGEHDFGKAMDFPLSSSYGYSNAGYKEY